MKNAIKVMGAAAAFVFAFAAEAATETVDGYTWSYRIVDGTAEIYNDGDTAISPDPQGAITIPSTLGGKPVTRIGDSTMSYLGLLTSVKMPASVTSIGSYAFNHCLQLASVEMPGVKTIGNSAFRSYQLSNISIPPSVTTVGSAGIKVKF